MRAFRVSEPSSPADVLRSLLLLDSLALALPALEPLLDDVGAGLAAAGVVARADFTDAGGAADMREEGGGGGARAGRARGGGLVSCNKLASSRLMPADLTISDSVTSSRDTLDAVSRSEEVSDMLFCFFVGGFPESCCCTSTLFWPNSSRW